MGLHDDALYEEAVRRVAGKLRAALEQGNLPLVSLTAFPRGACGDTCELLGQFLVDEGLGQSLYYSGQRDVPLQSHAWLERDGLILDITADQFTDVAERVMLTKDRRWHSRFRNSARQRTANLEHFVDGVNAAEAQLAYVELRRRATSAEAVHVI
ncbi:hypothetical protein [Asanoa iriomotensis]|uniref:Transglutaminase superfamily protein n=1 Tax=Asanoa iriomotensis TaxID=234613 RepID=A0ABQ4C1M3_9ACTN|nr:hypothetical protein [Asanoa iriomotensis]GIF56676.1 hypothetical protein Air01nite_27710 [Asanoa iriomotensis]